MIIDDSDLDEKVDGKVFESAISQLSQSMKKFYEEDLHFVHF